MDISIAVETSSGLERRLRVTVPRREIEEAIDARLRELGGSLRIKGFRPGKVPLNLVRQRHDKETRRTVIQEFLQGTCREAIRQRNMEAVAPARIEQQGEGDGDSLVFIATFEIYPDILVAGLDELAAVRPVVSVTATDTEELVERLRRQRRSWSPCAGPAATGDRLIIDFDGKLEGETPPAVHAAGVALVLGESPVRSDVAEHLAGSRAGATRAFDLPYPGDFPDPALAGRRLHLTVAVREVARATLPDVDAGFCRSLGITSGAVSDLVSAASADMTRDAQTHVATVMRLQLLGQLAAKTAVELPQTLCQQELARLRETAADPAVATIADCIAAVPRQAQLHDVAGRKVSMGLIVRQLFRDQKLRILREEINERIVAGCPPGDDPEARQNWYYEHPEALSAIEFAVMDDKVVDWLTRRASIVEKPMSFVELVALRAELAGGLPDRRPAS